MSFAIEEGRLLHSSLPTGKNIQTGQAEETTEEKNTIRPEASKQEHTPRYDEFIRGADQSSESSAGIYGISTDENGEPEITFKNPEKKAAGKEKPDAEAEKPKITKCTVNSDKVESEIKKLQEKRQKIQQQIEQNADNSEKRAALAQELSTIDAELKAKSSDAYKKQNASYTFSQVAE